MILRISQQVFLSGVLLFCHNIAFGAQVTGTGYPLPFENKAKIDINNRGQSNLICTIEAFAVVRDRSGNGSQNSLIASFPVVKTLRGNRSVELDFDFSYGISQLRSRWNDSSSIITELSGPDGSIISPYCVPPATNIVFSTEQQNASFYILRDRYGVMPWESTTAFPMGLTMDSPVPMHVFVSMFNATLNGIERILIDGGQAGVLHRGPFRGSISDFSINPIDWYFEAARSLAERYGIDLRRTQDSKFYGNRFITRGEFQAQIQQIFSSTNVVAGDLRGVMTTGEYIVNIHRMLAYIFNQPMPQPSVSRTPITDPLPIPTRPTIPAGRRCTVTSNDPATNNMYVPVFPRIGARPEDYLGFRAIGDVVERLAVQGAWMQIRWSGDMSSTLVGWAEKRFFACE